MRSICVTVFLAWIWVVQFSKCFTKENKILVAKKTHEVPQDMDQRKPYCNYNLSGRWRTFTSHPSTNIGAKEKHGTGHTNQRAAPPMGREWDRHEKRAWSKRASHFQKPMGGSEGEATPDKEAKENEPDAKQQPKGGLTVWRGKRTTIM